MTENLKAEIEAILFASGDPISVDKLAEATEYSTSEILDACNELVEDSAKDDRGIAVLELNYAFQMATKSQYADSIKHTLQIKKNTPLSPAAMEVLAIICYNQPVTKSFVQEIRGVDSSQIVNSLVEKGLIKEMGRLDLPGRPIAYGTTSDFLRCFGVKSLSELPQIPDESDQLVIEEVIGKQV